MARASEESARKIRVGITLAAAVCAVISTVVTESASTGAFGEEGSALKFVSVYVTAPVAGAFALYYLWVRPKIESLVVGLVMLMVTVPVYALMPRMYSLGGGFNPFPFLLAFVVVTWDYAVAGLGILASRFANRGHDTDA